MSDLPDPPLQLTIRRDVNGRPTAVAEPPHQPVGWYLEQDVGASSETCELMLAALAEVEGDHRRSWVGTGNAHTVRIDAEGVLVENAWAIPVSRCTITHDEFRQALASWRDFVGT